MNKNLSKGDRVQVLDEDTEGHIVNIVNQDITIETTDGFELTYQANELLKIPSDSIDISKATTTGSIVNALHEKVGPKKRSFIKEKKSRKDEFILEVDLHIEKLIKDHARLEKFDILTIQLDTARGQLEFAIKNRIPRMVFIHGVGEGILKTELEYLLGRYSEVVYEDANYQKYGVGATQIYIKQNPNR